VGSSVSTMTESNTATPLPVLPPPPPQASVYRGTADNSVGSCSSGCYRMAFSYQNVNPGTYTLRGEWRDAGQSNWQQSSYTYSRSLGTSGSGEISTVLGTIGEHDEVRIQFTGGPTPFTSDISGAWG